MGQLETLVIKPVSENAVYRDLSCSSRCEIFTGCTVFVTRDSKIQIDILFPSTNLIDGLESIRVSLAQRIDRGANVAIANPDTRKRLLINRHIAKMTPEEIARRFSVYVVLRTACSSARSHGKSSTVKTH